MTRSTVQAHPCQPLFLSYAPVGAGCFKAWATVRRKDRGVMEADVTFALVGRVP
jgi:hypothetical protein